MTVESIGQVSSTYTSTNNNENVSQDEFIKLFLAQLNSQDPLEPLNNREFLAQLAQFSSLEQNRESNEKLHSLLAMNSSNQALNLLGKTVQVKLETGVEFDGSIEAIHYDSSGPKLTIKNEDGNFIDNITLTQVTVVRQ